jgi:hypothetical protein
MTTDELEFSDYGRKHGPEVALAWLVFFSASLTCDGLILWAIRATWIALRK